AVAQASSSVAADYKSGLIRGGTVIDMTGGLGVDTYFFSRSADRVIYLEKERELADSAAHNFIRLKVNNVKVIHEECMSYIRKTREKVDCIYIDPSRRRGSRRVFRIEEAEPDAGAVYLELLEQAGKVIIKLSPFLDIRYLIEKFQYISRIHVVAIDQECREILLVLDREEGSGDPEVVTWSKEKDKTQEFISSLGENEMFCGYDLPGDFIYDPNVAIRKAGLFNVVGNRFKLKKLAPNSHLYTGNTSVEDFPGRSFNLIQTLTFKEFLKTKSIKRASIATRNFRLKAEDIRKRTGIGEGGDTFIFCTTNMENEPLVLVTHRNDIKK
ncbi:MAG: RsmD family RNA methyltransferase, partial [Cyclobacteriaceae bacterium]|nr:RsmD family RNA methyltransferase [Cyclobacteriaceae bacterium]